jgi:hypothetical protein
MGSGSRAAIRPVVHDLQRIFGERLDAVVIYGALRHGPVPSLVLVKSLTIEDLTSCAARTSAWHRAGAAPPLVLTPHDFARSLDAFPIEYGEILTTQDVVFGRDPFDGLSVKREDLRRACEVQVKSHLVHLREDYLEAGGRPADVEFLVRESAPGFAVLLRHLARLDNVPATTNAEIADYATRRVGLDERSVDNMLALADADDVTASVDPAKMFPSYLEAMDKLAAFVDRWRER